MDRKIDFMVGKHVMNLYGIRDGAKREDGTPFPEWEYVFRDWDGTMQPVPLYHRKIQSAWEILNKSSWFDVRKFVDGWYRVRISMEYQGVVGECSYDNFPLAVCLASLQSVGVVVDLKSE